jgi:hypothetical protein
VFDTAGFGVGRTHEYHIPLQWLYENYPRNNSKIIWETMELMIDGGVLWGADWRTYFVEGVYPEVYYDGITPWNLSWVFLHGVNHAEGRRQPIYSSRSGAQMTKMSRSTISIGYLPNDPRRGVEDADSNGGRLACQVSQVLGGNYYWGRVYHGSKPEQGGGIVHGSRNDLFSVMDLPVSRR